MKKQHKKPSLIHQLRQKDYDMAMQKKLEVYRARSKRYWILHNGAKHGAKIRISVHRRPLQTASFCRAVERSVAATKKSGNPVAKYDVERRQAYLEYPDGKRTYVE